MIAFDVDGTLLHHGEGLVVWEVLNRRFIGDSTINRERYAWFRSGQITYAEWVDLDIGGWRDAGATRDQIVEAMAELTLALGTQETLGELRRRGYGVVAVSGTLDITLDHCFPDHPFEEVFTNRIQFSDDGSIESWEATPFDGEGKVRALEKVADERGIALENIAFVGDAANDVPAARAVGFSVAFNSRCVELIDAADARIPGPDLRAILPHFPLRTV